MMTKQTQFSSTIKTKLNDYLFIRYFSFFLILTFSSTACIIAEPESLLDPVTEINTISEPTEPTEPAESTEPVASFNSDAFCLPQPNTPTNMWILVPNLKTWVDELQHEDCTLLSGPNEIASLDFIRTSAAYGEVGHTDCQEDGCWVTLPSIAKTWQEISGGVNRFDQFDKQLWRGVIDARNNSLNGQVEAKLTATRIGYSAIIELIRRWDRHGQLLEEHIFFNGMKTFSIFNQWQGHLLTHTTLDQTVHRLPILSFEHEYTEDGKLSRSSLFIDYELQQHSQWQYDELNRPIQVTRSSISPYQSELKTWLIQRWSYDQNGFLNHLQSLLNTKLAHLMPQDRKLDSFQPFTHSNQLATDLQTAHWNDSKNCFQLPFSFEVGYPGQDRVYDLGWSIFHRPQDLDIAHGIRPAYTNKEASWFGHFGIDSQFTYTSPTIDLLQQLHNEDEPFMYRDIVIHVTTDFVHHHPLEESISILTEEDHERLINGLETTFEEVQEMSQVQLTHRTWERNGELLLIDKLNILDQDARQLSFEYNRQGDLIRRTLHRNEQKVADHHWTYHPQKEELPQLCQIATYEILQDNELIPFVFDPWLNERFFNHHTFGTQMEPYAPFKSRLQLHTTVDHSAGYCTVESPAKRLMTLKFDDNQRVIFQLGGEVMKGFHTHAEISFDDQTSHISGVNLRHEDGSPRGIIHRFVYDEQGKLIEHDELVRGSREQYIYDCR